MTVKIVTDSCADLPPELLKKLDVTVVPVYLRFGEEVYRDGIDLTAEHFYERSNHSQALPVTSVPSPATFAAIIHPGKRR